MPLEIGKGDFLILPPRQKPVFIDVVSGKVPKKMEKIKTFAISITRILITTIMRGTTVSQRRRLDMVVVGLVPGTTGRNNTTITRGLGSTDVVSECSDPLVNQPSCGV